MSLRFLAFFGANRYFQFYYPRVESILKKEEKQIQGFNGSVIITVENDALRYHRYDDYGMNHSIGWGHSYNGEWIDSNGLVYLRARYYDPNGETFEGIEISVFEDDEIPEFLINDFGFTVKLGCKIFLIKDREGNFYYINAMLMGVYHNQLGQLESGWDKFGYHLGEEIMLFK